MSLETLFRQNLLKYLAMISIGVGAGEAAAAEQLRRIPDQVVDEVLGELSGDDWDQKNLSPMMRLLAHDSRVAIRRRVAELTIDFDDRLALEDLEPLLQELVSDPSAAVRATASEALSSLLTRASALESTELVCRWASSDNPAVRFAMARALAVPFVALGADLAVDQLSRDPSAEVRKAAVEAVRKRHAQNPDLYAGVLRRLAFDPHRTIRKAARKAEMSIGSRAA